MTYRTVRLMPVVALVCSLVLSACAVPTPTVAPSQAATPLPTSAITDTAFTPTTVLDFEGNAVEIADISRVIALGGGVTEIVYALGAESHLVAVDTSSIYPDAATQLPQVGYQRTLAAEGVLALNPTLILATTEAGPPEAIEQLRNSGVTFLIIPSEPTVDGAKDKIRRIAAALGRTEQGEALVAAMEADIAKAQAAYASVETKPRVMFIYARGANTLLVSGTGTSAAAMIELAGGENAVTEFADYLPLTAEAAVTANPDVLLLLTLGLESIGGEDGLLQLPGIAETKAGQERRIVAMDDLYLLGFGPRLGAAVLDLTQALHPELELE